MTAPIPDDSWLSYILTGVGGGAVTAIGSLLWFVRKDGQKDQTLEELTKRFEAHEATDKKMFDEVKDLIAENAKKQDSRHEDNIRAIGKLPDKDDFRDLRDIMSKRLDTLEGLVRQRAPN